MGGSYSELTPPWRTVEWGNKKVELEKLKSFCLESGNIKHLRILLCGPAGSGKSSFINSVDSICRNRITVPADVNSCGLTNPEPAKIHRPTFTLNYKTYQIQKEKPGQHYPFVFNDTMGLEGIRGVCVDDIKLAMKGHVKEDYKFNPESALDDSNDFYNKNPTANEKAHVLVCVVAVNDVTDEEIIKKMIKVRLAARDLGIPQIAIVTKIDEKGCPQVQQDIKNVYKSMYIKDVMQKFSAAVGFPMNCIFPVKNYHEEVDLNDDVDMLILSALRMLLDLANDRLNATCLAATNQQPKNVAKVC